MTHIRAEALATLVVLLYLAAAWVIVAWAGYPAAPMSAVVLAVGAASVWSAVYVGEW